MAAKKVLTPRALNSLRPADDGKRYIVWDAYQPGLGCRVTDRATEDGRAAHVAFVVIRRRPGQKNPDTVVLGVYSPNVAALPDGKLAERGTAMSLADARRLARETLNNLAQGRSQSDIDAERRRQEEARRLEEARKQRHTFGAAAEEFIAEYVNIRLRSARAVEALIRRELLGQEPERVAGDDGRYITRWVEGKHKKWRVLPIVEITQDEAMELLEKINSPHQARKTLMAASKLFGWVLSRTKEKRYGLKNNPVKNIKLDQLIDNYEEETKSRDRTLTDTELRLMWRAAEWLGYPYGDLIRALMLSGQRVRELSGSRWPEIENDVLTVPAERMKAKRKHSLPLTSCMLELLNKVPRFTGGDYIFTVSGGVRPVGGISSNTRRALDRAIAEQRKAEGITGEMEPFRVHDVRRSVRTRLSTLGIKPFIAEQVIAHTQTGVHAVYDLHTYDSEKLGALTAWEKALKAIVNPPVTDNVVPMRCGRRA